MKEYKTFLEQYKAYEVPFAAIDDFIDEWHNGNPDDLELHEFLGMSLEQYNHWVDTGIIKP